MLYTQTNAVDNAVVAYSLALEPLGSFLTGGRGTDEPHLPSQGSIVAADDRLFVVNAGSGNLTVFELDGMQRLALGLRNSQRRENRERCRQFHMGPCLPLENSPISEALTWKRTAPCRPVERSLGRG